LTDPDPRVQIPALRVAKLIVADTLFSPHLFQDSMEISRTIMNNYLDSPSLSPKQQAHIFELKQLILNNTLSIAREDFPQTAQLLRIIEMDRRHWGFPWNSCPDKVAEELLHYLFTALVRLPNYKNFQVSNEDYLSGTKFLFSGHFEYALSSITTKN
jgi:hypothetical protein